MELGWQIGHVGSDSDEAAHSPCAADESCLLISRGGLGLIYPLAAFNLSAATYVSVPGYELGTWAGKWRPS